MAAKKTEAPLPMGPSGRRGVLNVPLFARPCTKVMLVLISRVAPDTLPVLSGLACEVFQDNAYLGVGSPRTFHRDVEDVHRANKEKTNKIN